MYDPYHPYESVPAAQEPDIERPDVCEAESFNDDDPCNNWTTNLI